MNSNNHDLRGGFDVDRATYSMYPIRPTSIDQWEPAEIAADYAASKWSEDEGASVEYKQLVKCTVQTVAGMIYYLTFTAIDNSDQVEKLYRAKVWVKPGSLKLELMFFEEFRDSDKTAEEMRKKISPILDKIRRRKARHQASNSSHDVEKVHVEPKSVIRSFEATNKELLVNGFCFLVKEMKIQHPSWKYTRVRKAASKKWRSFGLGGRAPYLVRAQMKFADDLCAKWRSEEASAASTKKSTT